MEKPNFFIIGAPRAGTTFMQKHLGDHPDIFMAPGEPSYFCSDYIEPRLSKDEYLNLFQDSEDYKIRGEKTVFYLPSKEAMQKISDFNSEAKIMVMLRNPIEAAYSLHSKMLSVGRETIEDFQEAWRRQEERTQKKDRMYQGKLKINALVYGEVYKLGQHLSRVYEEFPKDQVKIIIFDEFVEDEEATYKDVLDFLNLSYKGKTDFSAMNSHRRPKSKVLNRLFSLRGLIPVQKTKQLLNINGRMNILSRIRQLNEDDTKREPLPDNFQKELSAYFEEDVELLSDILDKDLTYWLEN